MPLTPAQFIQEAPYAHGSVRNHVVHLISVDATWFNGLRGLEIPEPLNPADFADRQKIKTHWEGVVQEMRAWLANLTDEMLFARPLEGEDAGLMVWQVLIQVVNHGTDHRAQVLRMVHDLGVKTTSQDYIFYAYDNPL